MAMAGWFKDSEDLSLSPRDCLRRALFQGMRDDVKMDAGDVLVALSHSVLVSAGTELIFFLVAGIVLCFGLGDCFGLG